MTRFFSIRPRTMRPRSWPSRTRIASSRLPSVADRPQTTRPGFQRFRRASASWTCTPRFDAHQLVPLVDDHGVHGRELVVRRLARQHQAQRLGRRDERGRKAPVLPGALDRRGVAGADADRPGDAEVVERRADRACRVGGERAHRRQPEDAERRWRAAHRHAERSGAGERAEPDGVGLAGAGRRVQQTALARRPSPPRPRAGTRTAASPAPRTTLRRACRRPRPRRAAMAQPSSRDLGARGLAPFVEQRVADRHDEKKQAGEGRPRGEIHAKANAASERNTLADDHDLPRTVRPSTLGETSSCALCERLPSPAPPSSRSPWCLPPRRSTSPCACWSASLPAARPTSRRACSPIASRTTCASRSWSRTAPAPAAGSSPRR